MAAGLGANPGEGRHFDAVLLQVLLASTAKVAERQRNLAMADEFVGNAVEISEGRRAVLEDRAQRARAHLLEADGTNAVGRTALDCLPRQIQRRRTGGTIVVDVHDRDARMPTLYSTFCPAVESP